jgi:SAM-dependent methyltransferase
VSAALDETLGYYQAVAPYYDHELAHRGDEAFWRALGRRFRGRNVLDVGAGTGRATALLASEGATVVGIDVSPEMLALARRRLAGEPNARLVRADMRAFTFLRPFDLVVAADDPFSHLTTDRDRASALECIAAALTRGGRFVLDALWFPAEVWAELAAGRGSEREVPFEDRVLRVHELWRQDGGAAICTATYDYSLDGVPAARASFRARPWTTAELANAFDAAGLPIERRWGGYDGESWHPGSAHLVVEARKR